jgi:hypothetical protein
MSDVSDRSLNHGDLELRHFDLRIKEVELAIRQNKLELDSKSQRKIDWNIFILLMTAIIGAVIAFISSAIVTSIEGSNQLDVERQKSENALVIEAVKTGDLNKALENLAFFVEAGFLRDPKGNLSRLISERRSPVLPAALVQPVEASSVTFGTPIVLTPFGHAN